LIYPNKKTPAFSGFFVEPTGLEPVSKHRDH